jgi:hypothetical protein
MEYSASGGFSLTRCSCFRRRFALLRWTLIANFREGEVSGRPTDVRIGKVRYSSSRRFQRE